MNEEPLNTEQILANVANMDAARLTLRWALDRIRYLEGSTGEMMELLKQTQSAKEQALQELASTRETFDKREQDIARKERMAAELQGMLQNVFKGEIDVKDIVRQRDELEQLKAQVESRAQERIGTFEEKSKQEIEEVHRRLAAMETAHAQDLAQAERRYQDQLEEMRRQREAEGLAQQEKESRFREDLLDQIQKQAEQYHQKLVLLQLEYSSKRKDLQKEYDQLKERLLDESKQIESHPAYAVRVAEARWISEKQRLEKEVLEREEQVQRQQTKLTELEQAFFEKQSLWTKEIGEMRQKLQQDHHQDMEDVHKTIRAQYQGEIQNLRQELLKQTTVQTQKILEWENLRRQIEQDYESKLAGASQSLKTELEETRRALKERYQAEVEALQAEIREKTASHAGEQETTRQQNQAKVQALESEIQKLTANHAAEMQEALAKLHKFQEVLEANQESELNKRLHMREEQIQQQQESLQKLEKSIYETSLKKAKEVAEQEHRQEIQGVQRALQESQSEVEKLRHEIRGQAQADMVRIQQSQSHMHEMESSLQTELSQRLKAEQEAAARQMTIRQLEMSLSKAKEEARAQNDLVQKQRETLLLLQQSAGKSDTAGQHEKELIDQQRKTIDSLQESLKKAEEEARVQNDLAQKHQEALKQSQESAAKPNTEVPHLKELLEQQRQIIQQLHESVRKSESDAKEREDKLVELQAQLAKAPEALTPEQEAGEIGELRKKTKQYEEEIQTLRRTSESQAATQDLHTKEMQEARIKLQKLQGALDAYIVKERQKAEEEIKAREEQIEKQQQTLQQLEKELAEQGGKRTPEVEELEKKVQSSQAQIQALWEASQKRSTLHQKEVGEAQAKTRETLEEMAVRLAKLRREREKVIQAQQEASERARNIRNGVLAGILMCGLIVAGLAYTNSGTDYSIPVSHPSGIFWQKDTLWLSDWQEKTVYQLNLKGKEFKTAKLYPLPGAHITAMAVAESKIFLIDSITNQIQRRKVDDLLTLEATLQISGATPNALFFDGKNIWVSVKDANQIYELANDDKLTIVNTFMLGHRTTGLYVDGKMFWTTDAQSGLFYRHNPAPDLTTSGIYALAEVDRKHLPVSCFTWRGKQIWIGIDGQKRLLERPWWRLRPRNYFASF